MFKVKYIIFSSEYDFKFILNEEMTFNLEYDLGKWQLLDPKTEEVVAVCDNNVVTVKVGYMWDGSTVIGEYYEDEQTMEASLLHDVLYNAKKNPQNIEVPFSLFLADKIMMRHLLKLYKGQGFIKSWLFPHLYYWGLTTVGIPWKWGNNDYYTLQKKEE